MDVAAGLLAAARSAWSPTCIPTRTPWAAPWPWVWVWPAAARRSESPSPSRTRSPNRCATCGMALVVDPDELVADGSDMFVSLDVGSRERLGSLVRVLDACPMSLVIATTRPTPGSAGTT